MIEILAVILLCLPIVLFIVFLFWLPKMAQESMDEEENLND